MYPVRGTGLVERLQAWEYLVHATRCYHLVCGAAEREHRLGADRASQLLHLTVHQKIPDYNYRRSI